MELLYCVPWDRLISLHPFSSPAFIRIFPYSAAEMGFLSRVVLFFFFPSHGRHSHVLKQVDEEPTRQCRSEVQEHGKLSRPSRPVCTARRCAQAGLGAVWVIMSQPARDYLSSLVPATALLLCQELLLKRPGTRGGCCQESRGRCN